jgi:integrase
MARRKKGELPRYRLHKQSGQAVVSLPTGGTPRYRDVLLGPFDSSESKREYTRVINEWLAAGMLAPAPAVNGRCPDLAVSEVCLRFWKHAEVYYRLVDGSPSGELDNYKHAQAPLIDLYGLTPASEFGPLKLKAVRQKMIDSYRYLVRFRKGDQTWERWVPESRFRQKQDGQGCEAEWKGKWKPVELLQRKKTICRKEINRRIELLKRTFKWAVSEELIPPEVYQALMAVRGLRRGHPGTYERPKVKPVPQQHVDAVLPFLCPQVGAMVRLQQLIGARSSEICAMRGRDIDRSGPVWWYRIDPNEVPREGPANLHKTAHIEEADGSAVVKALPIGPKAQAILQDWLRENKDEFLFQPKESRQQKYEERRKTRKTKLWQSHVAHQARKKKKSPKRAPRDCYDPHSYARAIARACKKAGVPHWHPHQLKHVCGTEVRRKFGLEGSRAYMGHTKLSTAEIYAEMDMELVEKIALEMG